MCFRIWIDSQTFESKVHSQQTGNHVTTLPSPDPLQLRCPLAVGMTDARPSGQVALSIWLLLRPFFRESPQLLARIPPFRR